MVNITFIVGKDAATDSYPIKYNSSKAPKWLKTMACRFEKFADKDDKYFPSDVAMGMYLAYKYPKANIDCINGREITKAYLDKFDVVYVIYDPIEIFHCGFDKTCPKEKDKFEKILKSTTASVYPYPEFHKYIIVKPSYYTDLKRAGIPVASFVKGIPKNIIRAPQKFKNEILKKGWKGIIVKPSYSGYSIGIKVFKNLQSTKASTIQSHFQKLYDKGFPSATIQEYVPEFKTHLEFRTYWLNGKYERTIGTGMIGGSDDTFVSEGGTIPDRIKKKLQIIGKCVLKAIRQYYVGKVNCVHPLVRVDFGCCIETKNCGETYFVNEVETMACNLLADESEKIVEKLADTLYTFGRKIKGKTVTSKRSTFKAKNLPCTEWK
jgi:hypothetical protein